MAEARRIARKDPHGRGRRAFFLLFLGARSGVASAPPKLADPANRFATQLKVWADQINRTPPGGVNYKAVEAWEPLPKMWRELEKAWRVWLMGH